MIFIKVIISSWRYIRGFVSQHLRGVIIAVVSIVITAGGVGAYELNKEEAPTLAVVKKGTITETVGVTGKVKPTESIELSFDSSGRVAYVYGEVSSTVSAGQTLAYLSGGEAYADLEQAKAALLSEEARYMEMKRGVKPEELALQEASVLKAKADLDEAKTDGLNTLRETYALSDDAVRSKAYQFFNSPRSYNATLKIPQRSYDDTLDIEKLRRESEESLLAFESLLVHGTDSISNDLGSARLALYTIQRFLDKLAIPVNELTTSDGYSETEISSFKTDIYTARSNISSAISAISSSIQAIRSAEANLLLEERDLAVKGSGSSEGELEIQRAVVEKMKAAVSRSSAELSRRAIVSPINGIITRQDIKQGETVSGNTPVISVMSNSNFEIEVFVPEADVEHVSVGDIASVTLDAYADDVVFTARISRIDPAETVIQGVSAYRAILQFDGKDERIRSGMTANVEIAALVKNDVLIVPTRAVYYGDESDFVKVFVEGKEAVEIPVVVGTRSDDGDAEISGKIGEGDQVILPK